MWTFTKLNVEKYLLSNTTLSVNFNFNFGPLGRLVLVPNECPTYILCAIVIIVLSICLSNDTKIFHIRKRGIDKFPVIRSK